jgi:hypothetical protein
MSNLRFENDVDTKTAQSRDSKSRDFAKQPTDDDLQVASSEKR